MQILMISDAGKALKIHILILIILTSTTNASAIYPEAFGGKAYAVCFAILTFMIASLETIIKSYAVKNYSYFSQKVKGLKSVLDTNQQKLVCQGQYEELLWLHKWSCVLSAFVSIICGAILLLS